MTTKDWRPALIRQAAFFMIATGVLLSLGLLFGSALPFFSPLPMFVIAWLIVLALTLTPWVRVKENVQAALVVGYAALGAALTLWQLGPVLNSGVALLMSVLFAGLLFGRKVASWLVVAHALLLLTLGLCIDAGLIEPPSTRNFDPTQLRNWIRVTVVFAAVGGGVVFAVLGLVGHLQAMHDEAQRMVDALVREQAVRRRLEGEQESARRAVSEAQRLESMGRLAGGVAHDFNNALTVIMAAADELRDVDHPLARELAEEILAASASAGALTKQLLAVGRRDLSRPVPLDVDAALRALEKPMRRALPDDVVFFIEAASNGRVLIDPTHFQQIVLNLVLNARDAMPRGGTLSVTSSAALLNGEAAVALTVRDTGAGLDPEVRTRIFEPFFTTKDTGRGTGLGLASVYGMVQRAQGLISVDSKPGEGATFEVLLPCAPHAAVPAQAIAVSREEDAGASPKAQVATGRAPSDTLPSSLARGKVRPILVAEDQGDVRAAMCRALQHAGFTTLEARNGDEAREQLRTHGHELLLFCTDAVMPGVPMSEVLDEVRRTLPALPVLLCSGYVEEDLVRRDLEAGHGAFLEKPFTAAALAQAVRTLLKGRPSIDEPDRP